jgi:hypothetical protein
MNADEFLPTGLLDWHDFEQFLDPTVSAKFELSRRLAKSNGSGGVAVESSAPDVIESGATSRNSDVVVFIL